MDDFTPDLNSDPERLRLRAEDAKFADEKNNGRIRKLIAKHELEVDSDTEEIIRHMVTEGKKLKGVSKLIDHDFIVMLQLRMLYDENVRTSTKQRIIEFLAELNGLMPTGAKGMAAAVANLTMEAINE